MPIQSFEICVTGGTLTNVETLTTRPGYGPRSKYEPYTDVTDTSAGTALGVGTPVLKWEWSGSAPADLVAALRVIIPDASAAVDIRTITTDYTTPTYATYRATAKWPKPFESEYYAGGYTGLVIEFVNLVAY